MSEEKEIYLVEYADRKGLYEKYIMGFFRAADIKEAEEKLKEWCKLRNADIAEANKESYAEGYGGENRESPDEFEVYAVDNLDKAIEILKPKEDE